MQGLSKVAISGVISRKVDEWLASITDTDLRSKLFSKVMVSGGCIASMLKGEQVNDYDIYLTDREVVIALAKYYAKQFAQEHKGREALKITVNTTKEDRVSLYIQSKGVAGDDNKNEYADELPPDADMILGSAPSSASMTASPALQFELTDTLGDTAYGALGVSANTEMEELASDIVQHLAPPSGKKAAKYRPVYLTSNAITLSDKVQIVIRFYGTPEEIHTNFDFVHCQNYWLNGNLVLKQAALESLLSMKLQYIGSKYPLCSLIRTRKFVKRGWTAPASVYVKAAYQCAKLDWNKLETWYDQLIGVDSGYFMQVIQTLAKEQAEGRTLDGDYVIGVIDKLL